MKNTYSQKLGLSFMAVALFLASCGSNATFSKRYHNRGFNIAWGGGADASSNNPTAKKVNSAKQSQVVPVTSEKQVTNAKESVTMNFTVPVLSYASASPNIKGIRQEMSTGIHSVKLAEKSNEFELVSMKLNNQPSADLKMVTQSKAVLKLQKKLAASGPGKSQIVAAILCFLVGMFGVHRFYLGYTGTGILMLLLGLSLIIPIINLLTGFLLTIWILVDLIRIVMGNMQPADGNYTETL
jgi:TM2 domain-containing membrane protein YozV